MHNTCTKDQALDIVKYLPIPLISDINKKIKRGQGFEPRITSLALYHSQSTYYKFVSTYKFYLKTSE